MTHRSFHKQSKKLGSDKILTDFNEFLSLSLSLFFGLQLLYNVVLVSAKQQSESAVCLHISPLS